MSERTVCIKVDEALYRSIHIRIAQQGVTLQDYCNRLIEKDLFPERFPVLTEDQIEQLAQVGKETAERVQRILQPTHELQQKEQNRPKAKHKKSARER